MIYNSEFQSDQNKKEFLLADLQDFPFICNHVNLDTRIDHCIPWHWHTAFELDYIAEGEIELRTADDVFLLKKGDISFVNSGVMHYFRATTSNSIVYSHLFEMSFLSGMPDSLFEKKYMLPVVKNKEPQLFIIHPDTHRRIRIAEKFLDIIELSRKEDFGYEFEVRAQLGRLWCLFLEETQELRAHNTASNTVDTERMKLMLQYIHEHYMEKVTLEDIAFSANISSRECTRCFQRCMKSSPVHYLTEYRVRMAARQLIQTNCSILEISENCGFSSSSYFGKIFHTAMGCTPKDYRKNAISSSL